MSIVRELQADPRQSNVALGRKVQLSEGAVRRRIDGLVSNGHLRFTVQVDPAFDGLATQALLRLRCAPHLVDEVIETLKGMPELDTIFLCTGEFDITAVGRFASPEALRTFLTGRLGAVSGVVELQSELVLETVRSAANDTGGDA